ncbi:LLM class flavin-dependent oxidoreductase [Embleya sp. AB8]|uniref:LLM class flavin-dependent oxidoreductase n=1 Tax=Embleya sp. AB8 TaxID=3156304 RepID=UPI003C791287
MPDIARQHDARPQFGILLPTREQAIVGTLDAEPLLDFARRAESLGYDSLWAGDSLVARPRLDPLVVLAAAAATTRRIGLGTAALTPALRNPLIGANLITSLDHVSAGRLTLGLGSGFPIPETEREFAAVGASFRGRAGHLDEVVELWRRAWRGDRSEVDDGGADADIPDTDRLLRPARAGGPPLWLAGSDTPAVLRRVARRYDGWLPFLPSSDQYAKAWQRIGELSEAAGRPANAVTPGLYATLIVHRDEAVAKAELSEYTRRYYRRSLAEMASFQAYCWGPADKCAKWLSEYVQAGARHIVLRVGSLRPGDALEEIAETVLPAVRH